MAESKRVAVLGAGIAGLSAALEIDKLAKKLGKPVTLTVLEASPRIGGKILTEKFDDGALFECGPDSFITARPHALELVEELGLSPELAPTNPAEQTVFIYRGDKLRELPSGMSLIAPARIWPFLFSDVMSWPGKLRVACEPWVAAAEGEQDESIASFVRRRLGAEALEAIAGPMLAGIYAADAEQMSLRATFPQLAEMERSGGLLRWARSQRPAPAGASSKTMFMTLKGGLSRLAEAAARRLPLGALRTGSPAESLSRRGRQWVIRTPRGPVEADAVIATLPAWAMAEIALDVDLELAAVLREIRFASTATITFAYDASAFARAPRGFGFLVPRSEKTAIAGATFSSTKFPARAVAGQVLIRCFIGGDGREEALAQDDAALARSVASELGQILGLGGAQPRRHKLARWPRASPQYAVGHLLRLSRIDSCLKGHPGLFLAGCSYRGVGIGDCIRSGRQAAAQAAEHIQLSGRALAGAPS